jgi:hypothetical protein
LAGIAAGSLVFAVLYPNVEGFYMSSSMENAVLPAILGLSHWVVIAILAVLAAVMFLAMEKYEKRSRR